MVPSSQRRKVWLTPNTGVPCSNAPKTRKPLKFAGCPKLTKRDISRYWAEVHHIVGTCGGAKYCCLTSFFPIVDACLSCEDIARRSCAMLPRRPIFGDFFVPAFPASRVQHISDLHSKFAFRTNCHTMCRGMVDIQSATAEIGEEKRRRRRKKRNHGTKI